MAAPHGVPDARPLTAREVEQWLADSAAALGAHRISGSVGHRIAPRGSPPVVWVSLSSAWATGRLVRAGDGSSTVEAHRFCDGATVLSARHPTTTTVLLDELAAACAREL